MDLLPILSTIAVTYMGGRYGPLKTLPDGTFRKYVVAILCSSQTPIDALFTNINWEMLGREKLEIGAVQN